jgi:hypothetical protein
VLVGRLDDAASLRLADAVPPQSCTNVNVNTAGLLTTFPARKPTC